MIHLESTNIYDTFYLFFYFLQIIEIKREQFRIIDII